MVATSAILVPGGRLLPPSLGDGAQKNRGQWGPGLAQAPDLDTDSPIMGAIKRPFWLKPIGVKIRRLQLPGRGKAKASSRKSRT